MKKWILVLFVLLSLYACSQQDKIEAPGCFYAEKFTDNGKPGIKTKIGSGKDYGYQTYETEAQRDMVFETYRKHILPLCGGAK